MKYEELVKALRERQGLLCYGEGACPENCELLMNHGCYTKLHMDAAAAIEALQRELNLAEIAADDNARQVGELQAEVQELKRVNLEIFEDLPKIGEWVRKDAELYYWHECSKCGERPLYDRYSNKVLSAYCPNCGAKMEVQDGANREF